ncbi:TAXI family TRAP transporter solute-binding subunit [Oceaniglobus ichthyenteri]|uniref:TAXI family TRAP transporter solute-binding subunit n=1 Tax=Oceaniglobus ichthyenteri TaxID=2136177 RepID=UPI0013DDFC78|nr:TAXI family TRAP transporter solute-binding subunit [Oceaniglobus ichthyenteri]
MKFTAVLAGAFALAATTASAQIAAVGSTATGGTSQIGRTMSAAISEASSLQVRPQELANTADYIPLVNAGELEFGIANVVQYTYAVNGTGMSEGRPNPNLRMVATLMPFRNGYVVREDSGINSIADLKGKRAPVFTQGALGDFITKAYLANGGLTMDDVEGVAVPNFPRMWASFAEGSTDVTIVVVGAANSREYDATFGIKYLSYDDSPEAQAAMTEFLPQAYLQTLDTDSGIPGIDGPTNVNVFDYTFFAGADVPDDMVYTAVKALWEKEADLLAGGPFWLGFEKEQMGKDNGLEYHPGAIRFYEEMGVWNR